MSDEMTYELWDFDTGSVVGVYPSEVAALKVASDAAQRDGLASLDDVALVATHGARRTVRLDRTSLCTGCGHRLLGEHDDQHIWDWRCRVCGFWCEKATNNMPEPSAERWQFEQASTTWDRSLAGEGRTVPREEIQRIIAEVKTDE